MITYPRNNGSFLLSLLLVFTCITSLRAQHSSPPVSLYFNHLNANNGLTGKEVNCIYRDRRGFIWIGTSRGLNEYDGREVKTFTHNRFNPHSIVDDFIENIVEDDSGYLWIGTRSGISQFNPYSHVAVNYKHDPKDPFSLNDDYKDLVYIDKRGTIWVGTESGLSWFDRETGRFNPVTIMPDSLNKRTLAAVSSMLEDREGRFWLGTYSGLVLLDRDKHTFKRYIIESGQRNEVSPVTTLFEDHAGHLWVGIWGEGLCLFNPNTDNLTAFKWNLSPTIPGTVNIPQAIGETHPSPDKYILWVGSTEGLLKIVLPSNDSLPGDIHHLVKSVAGSLKKASFVSNNISSPHALRGENIHCIYNDAQNILWIGTDAGVNAYLQKNDRFTTLPVVRGMVTSIRADSFCNKIHYYITSWYGNGLVKLDENKNLVATWQRIPKNAENMDNGQISDVVRLADGKLWVATFNGLYSYDEKTEKYTAFLHQQGNINSPASNHIIALEKDDENNLWMSIYGGGVDEYNPLTGKVVHYRHHNKEANSLCDDLVWRIQKLSGDRMAFLTNNGLSIYDKKSHRFTNYVEQDKNNSLQGHIVSGLITEKNGMLWVSTDRGLNLINPETGKVILFASEEGLKDDNILGMAADTNNHIWLVSQNSIAIFDPKKKAFINYDEQNGLPVAKLTGAITADRRGNFLVGEENTLLKFTPADFKDTPSVLPVYLTQLSIGGKELIINRPLTKSSRVVLTYPQNNFSCTFDAPEFFNGKAVKYAYHLEGADDGWVNSGARNFVSYANLSPGDYILHVKAAGSDGVWNNTGTSLQIRVLPPFWNTWWFSAVAILFIVLLIYSLFTYRVRNIRRKEALKTTINKQLADMRLKAMRSRMNPHFMFNALNSIQECIYTGETNAAYKYLSKFSRLVRMILERSEQMFISVSQEIEMLRLYLELESLRFQQSFFYQITYDGLAIDFLEIPPMLVQPFVENAIWHGLLHKEGEKKLQIVFRADDDYIYVTIEDNGIGMVAAQAYKSSLRRKHQSLGIQLVSDQLTTVGKLAGREANIQTEDLFTVNATGQKDAAGTKITLTIPIIKINIPAITQQ